MVASCETIRHTPGIFERVWHSMCRRIEAQTHFQQQQQQQQGNNSPHHCKECGLYLNSAESLEVHLQYHKENLLNKWATQAAATHSEETNNNNTKTVNIKREFMPNTISAAADSSDSMLKKSPEYGSRATPETSNNFGHPPTPQSYHSASSPYQNPDNSTFSPGFQNYQPIKTERASPNAHYQQQSYSAYTDNQFFNMENPQNQPQTGYPQEYSLHKMPTQPTSFRYHPYQQQNSYDRNSQSQVSSSSPAYPPQPTPSPSPKQCDKCGYVCESATQLIEHLNVAHPPTPAPHLSSYQQNQHFMFGQHEIKTEDDAQSEILDLDSHKVHQVYQEEEKRQNGDINGHNPHSVTAMLSSWPHSQPPNKFQQDQRLFINAPDQKMYQNGVPHSMQEQKLFQPHQIHTPDYISNGVTTTSQDNSANIVTTQTHNYRPFEHLPPQTNTPVITSTQVPNNPPPINPPPSGKGTNWKSNEARRPKTYNCTACNKWFTSSGHLKRHYNTTLHKNAVKSSGQPDPASLPISAHHHPGRDSCSRGGDTSPDPVDDSRGEDQNNFERSGSIPGLLQQPPNGPYDRQPTANIHSPMNHNANAMSHNSLPPHSNLSNLSGGSPPNGEAGPSATTNLDTRGLLSLPSTPNPPFTTPGFGMAPMMPMDNSQFQMYPNGSAPHVTQATATNNHSITGELIVTETQQPLPSFAQIQNHRYGLLLSYGTANVGGAGPATAPYTFYDVFENANSRPVIYRQEEEDILTVPEPECILSEDGPYSPPNHNNNLSELQTITENEELKINCLEDLKVKFESQPVSPEKAHIKRDYEEGAGSPLITSTVQAKQTGLHKCFDCDKMFNKACYLTQHNKTFHSGDKPFKCTRCGKRFSCEKQYQEHSSKHAGDKPYKCDLCPKQFNHKTDLRRHMCLHTGQKPYACDTCGKGFIRKDHMLKHCETHAKKPHISKVTAVR
ncbi:hypothetical protein FQR65_LT09412 [Abscondita terminalis]|nr:hypothetical protein FQR65_LT09412 [Abscondita terminalis]